MKEGDEGGDRRCGAGCDIIMRSRAKPCCATPAIKYTRLLQPAEAERERERECCNSLQWPGNCSTGRPGYEGTKPGSNDRIG